MQLRYSYRLDPWPRHRAAFAKAFGCARVVFNDGLAARLEAHEAGHGYIADAELSARLTAAKATPQRVWLNEVSAVVLQQAQADLNSAYRNYLAARLYGRDFRRIGRFEPTSQTCSACGVRDGPKPLHVREWQCGACGTRLDRDINAAINVAKAAGLAVTACGAQVRPGSP